MHYFRASLQKWVLTPPQSALIFSKWLFFQNSLRISWLTQSGKIQVKKSLFPELFINKMFGYNFVWFVSDRSVGQIWPGHSDRLLTEAYPENFINLGLKTTKWIHPYLGPKMWMTFSKGGVILILYLEEYWSQFQASKMKTFETFKVNQKDAQVCNILENEALLELRVRDLSKTYLRSLTVSPGLDSLQLPLPYSCSKSDLSQCLQQVI